MTSRLDTPVPLLVLAMAGLAVVSGGLAGVDPKYGIGLAVGAVFLLVALNDVTVGVCVLAALTILDAQGNLGPAKLIGGVLALSWIAAIATGRFTDRTFVEARPVLVYGLVLFGAWVGLSFLWAENPGSTIGALARYGPNMLLLPIVYDAVREERHFVWIVATLVGAAGLAAAIGIVNPPPTTGDLGRASSTVGDANELAATLVVGASLAGALALRPSALPIGRLVAAGAAVLCVGSIFLTLSRGGLIATGAATLAAVVFAGRWRARAFGVGISVVLAAVVYFALFASLPARERVTNVGGGGGTGRVDLWTVGSRMVQAHPLRGIGAGNFQVSSVHYLIRPGVIHRSDYIISTPLVAHNTYLQVAAELGLPAAALFMAIVLFCLGCAVAAARRFERSGNVNLELLARGLIASMVGYLAAIVFITEVYSKLLWLLLALGPTLLALAQREDGSPRPAEA